MLKKKFKHEIQILTKLYMTMLAALRGSNWAQYCCELNANVQNDNANMLDIDMMFTK